MILYILSVLLPAGGMQSFANISEVYRNNRLDCSFMLSTKFDSRGCHLTITGWGVIWKGISSLCLKDYMNYRMLVLSLLISAPLCAKGKTQSSRAVSALKSAGAAFCLYYTARTSWYNATAFINGWNNGSRNNDALSQLAVTAGALGYCSYHLGNYALAQAQCALALD